MGIRWESRLGEIRDSLPLAAALGAGLFVIVVVLDVAFAQFTQFPVDDPPTDADALRELFASIPMRLFYGGITEELLLRWGLMAPIAYVLWWVRKRIATTTDRDYRSQSEIPQSLLRQQLSFFPDQNL